MYCDGKNDRYPRVSSLTRLPDVLLPPPPPPPLRGRVQCTHTKERTTIFVGRGALNLQLGTV